MEDITVEELKAKFSSGDELFILDVREDWEYDEDHIDGAKNLSVHTLLDTYEELNDWKEKEIIIHCKSGKRSKIAQEILSQKGYNTLNLLGGFDAWSNEQ